MYVKPKTPETVVRDPRSFVQLPPEGKRVSNSSFWIRRLASGCVVPTTAEAVAEGKASRTAEAKRVADAKKTPAEPEKPTKELTISKGSKE